MSFTLWNDSAASMGESMAPKSEQTDLPTVPIPAAPSGFRRSQRLILDVPLVICGGAEDHRPFREETFTITVNAHGGLLVLEHRVSLGQKILLMNPKNWDEREATVASLGPPYAGLATVGFQFIRPAPEFWAVSSPPADWNLA
jgi:hypothetical protein